MQFYTDRNGETAGPFGPEQTLEMIRQGDLVGSDVVWLEGTPEPVTVGRLLGPKSPAEADFHIFHGLRPADPEPSRLRRNKADAFEILERLRSFGSLPGLGLMNALSGGGLLALFCVGFYVWGTIDMNRRGAQEQHLEALRAKIVRFVDRHPELERPSLQQLRQAGVVDEEDMELIETLDARFHPVGAHSSGEAVVFTRTSGNTERRYYKEAKTNFAIWWFSPDRRLKIISTPKSPSSKARIVTLKRQTTGEIFAEYETEAYSVSPDWAPNSQAVAVEESLANGKWRLRLLRILGGGIEELQLPADIAPERLLAIEGKQGQPRWYSNHVTAERWLDENRLVVESYGGLSFLDPENKPIGTLSARYRFVLKIGDNGQVSILKREEISRSES